MMTADEGRVSSKAERDLPKRPPWLCKKKSNSTKGTNEIMRELIGYDTTRTRASDVTINNGARRCVPAHVGVLGFLREESIVMTLIRKAA